MKSVSITNTNRVNCLWWALQRHLRAEAQWVRVYAIELVLVALITMLCTASVFSLADRTGPRLPAEWQAELRNHRVSKTPLLDPVRAADCLVEAIIQVESGGDPRKVGKDEERGLMQIKPATWQQMTRRMYGTVLSFDRAFDPDINERVGRAYLADLQRFLLTYRSEWKSDERALLLACYNIGPGRVLQAKFDVRRLPDAVRDYVERASALHEVFLAEHAPVVNAHLTAGQISSTNGPS